ncbi:IS1182 family transposase [Aliiglaciecola sp. 3_MG-2023]|uniref:IS1182 family transposase n=1 Tax=Aliiglaciecola sp. 3_MG-2023 TaxID=3062644 RepID=UPI0026E3F8C2|nr:IS1182 family transposase [Aliiglaciecola sp. 3_MG-2023]MDO6693170.1 IS1182 family transposase [Aliiglaciecola sp. 3_MG-2023]
MSHHIIGQSRHQSTLFPEAIDDFVTEDNPIRVIDVFVDQLDLLALGFEAVNAKLTGRTGYHPSTMLKLYIYGYLNRIQSSRRLEKESHRNVELMWLLERLRPDFKTIANFRKDNGKGIKNVCRKFVELCRQLNMFDESVFVIDGCKFKAVNNKSKNYTPSKVQFHIDRVEKSIEKYLSQMDAKDGDEKDIDTTVSSSKLAWLEARLIELKALDEEVNEHPDKQVSQTDPDARLMKTPHMERQVCYNVQNAVDTKHHLIVEHDVSMTVDRGQLTVVAAQVQKTLGKKDITIIADKGYFSRNDIKATQDLGMTANVPQTDTSGSAKKGIFNKSLFKYDKNKDIYTCPAGEELPHRRNVTEDGLEQKVYVNHIACRDCTIRAKCTTLLKEPRKMKRWVHEEVIDAMQQRLDDNPDTPVLRKQTVEHPFGTIKMWMGATHFLMRSKKNGSIEMSLNVLADNLKRMMTIMGTTGLMEAISK